MGFNSAFKGLIIFNEPNFYFGTCAYDNYLTLLLFSLFVCRGTTYISRVVNMTKCVSVSYICIGALERTVQCVDRK